MVQVNLTASTGLHSADEFRNLVVKQSNGAVVRLKDVATVTLGAEDYEFGGRVRRQAGGLYRHPGRADRQSARRDRRRAPGISGNRGAAAARAQRQDRLRFHQIRERGDPRGHLQPARGFGHRHPRGLSVSRLGAFLADTDRRHSAVADRHLHHPAGARLFDQSADAAGAGAGHRSGRRRRHHRGGERQPSSRGRHGAGGRRHRRGARARRPDHRDDRGAGRGLCADRLPERADRRAVRGVRLRAGRRRDRFRHHRADAVADVVLAAAQGSRTRAPRLGGLVHLLHRPQLRLAARRLRAASACQLELSAGHRGIRADRAEQHLFPVRHRQDRAGAAGGSGRHHHAIDRGAGRHAAAAPALFAPSVSDFHAASGDRPRLPDRRARPVDRRHGVQALGRARQDHQPAAAGGAAGAEQGRRRAGRRLSAAAAARQHRLAGSVRHRHHRSVRAAVRHRAAISAAGAAERHVHLSRLRSEDRQSAIQCDHRSRQDRAARAEDERRRRRARLDARRRLRQLFQHERALLQGDPAGRGSAFA